MDFLKKPIAIWVAVAIAVTSIVGTGIYITRFSSDERAQPSSVKVEVAKVRRGSLVREMTVVGTLESANSVVMKAQVKGLISKVNIIGGEDVEEGDVLFEIDPRTYQARAKEAEAFFELAKAALEREQKLAERNFGAAKKLEEARAQFLKAQAQLESSQKDLEDTKIVAPFEGRVGLHRISVGTPITADLDLVTITDIDPVKVNFKIPSKFMRYLSLDQRVSIEVDSYPERQFEGRIEAIDALVDAGAQSVAVQATIPNPQNILKPGMFVRVKVTVGSKDDSLIIPEESVVAIGEQTYVWKVIEHPEKPGLFLVFRVEVLTGLQEKDRIEITRNLREDDIVVTVGWQKVANGVPVSFDLDSVDLAPAEAPVEESAEEQSEAVNEDQSISEDADAETGDEENIESPKQEKSLWEKIKGFFGVGSSEVAKGPSEVEASKAPDTDAVNESESITEDEVSEEVGSEDDTAAEASEKSVDENTDAVVETEDSDKATSSDSGEVTNNNADEINNADEPRTEGGASEKDQSPSQQPDEPSDKLSEDSAKLDSQKSDHESLYTKTKRKKSNLQALLAKKS